MNSEVSLPEHVGRVIDHLTNASPARRSAWTTEEHRGLHHESRTQLRRLIANIRNDPHSSLEGLVGLYEDHMQDVIVREHSRLCWRHFGMVICLNCSAPIMAGTVPPVSPRVGVFARRRLVPMSFPLAFM